MTFTLHLWKEWAYIFPFVPSISCEKPDVIFSSMLSSPCPHISVWKYEILLIILSDFVQMCVSLKSNYAQHIYSVVSWRTHLCGFPFSALDSLFYLSRFLCLILCFETLGFWLSSGGLFYWSSRVWFCLWECSPSLVVSTWNLKCFQRNHFGFLVSHLPTFSYMSLTSKYTVLAVSSLHVNASMGHGHPGFCLGFPCSSI